MFYHAVLRDECNEEFGVDITAPSRAKAYDKLRNMYESQVVQLESARDTMVRQRRTHKYLQRELDEGW